MNTNYRPELLTTPEEKISLLADIGVDYCLMLDFTRKFPGLPPGVHDTAVKRTLSGKIPGYRL